MSYDLWRMIFKWMMTFGGFVPVWMWDVDIVSVVDFTAKRLGGR